MKTSAEKILSWSNVGAGCSSGRHLSASLCGLAVNFEGWVIMDITYFGTNIGPDSGWVKIRHSNGNTTGLKQRIVLHSPDGFQWGYGGSGPADLALNMLYDYLLRTHRKNAKSLAKFIYQLFKRDFVACQGNELSITGDEIEKWLLGSAFME